MFEQVPRDMGVFCLRTQILKMILALIICAYEQVPIDMNVFCLHTQIFLKMLFDLPTLDYLPSLIYQRTKSNNDVQNTSMYL